MKYPNHILLDVKTKSTGQGNSVWALTYAAKLDHSQTPTAEFLNSKLIRLEEGSNLHQTLTNNTTSKVGQKAIVFTQKQNQTFNSPLWDMFTIHFLKKEFIYTKLKYSRCPEQDIVSGGVAAIFSGFLGFLICEKFGLELLDSGDFYTFFMYVVFVTFALRPFLKILSSENNVWHCFSYKLVYTFLKDLIILSLNALGYWVTQLTGGVYQYSLPLRRVLFELQFISRIYHFWRRVIIFLKNTPRKGYETFDQVK